MQRVLVTFVIAKNGRNSYINISCLATRKLVNPVCGLPDLRWDIFPAALPSP